MPVMPLCRQACWAKGSAGARGPAPLGLLEWGGFESRCKLMHLGLMSGSISSCCDLLLCPIQLNRNNVRMYSATRAPQSAYLGSRFIQVFLSLFSIFDNA